MATVQLLAPTMSSPVLPLVSAGTPVAASPVLLIVQVKAPLVAPTTTVPKLLVVVPESAPGRWPLPDSDSVLAVPPVVAVAPSVAVCSPAPGAVNLTWMLQLAPPASVVPVVQSPVAGVTTAKPELAAVVSATVTAVV